MTLYEIDRGLLDLIEKVDPETGEWVGDPEAWERLTLAKEAKIEGTACLIKDLKKDIEGFNAEIENLENRKRTAVNKAEWLRKMLDESLAGENFETARCRIRYKLNPEKVKLTDLNAAMAWVKKNAPDCLRYKPAAISLTDLKAEIKNGAVIPGAELVRETRLEVK